MYIRGSIIPKILLFSVWKIIFHVGKQWVDCLIQIQIQNPNPNGQILVAK